MTSDIPSPPPGAEQPSGAAVPPPPQQRGGLTPTPAAGRQQPGGPVPAPAQPDETMWAVLAHLSYFVLPFLGPLLIMLIVGPQRPFARTNAVEALNFHITWLLAELVAVVLILVVIGFFLFIGIALAGVVLAILAAVKAGQGFGYRYPVTLRLVT